MDQEQGRDVNNELYRVLREHNMREMERQNLVMKDNRSIAETMVRKQREADEDKSVVTASTSYATNANYVKINSGGDPRILLKPGIHPLNPEECDVYTSLVEDAENSTIMAMLNHNVSPEGDVEGFRFTCCEKGMAACMPLSRKMFFRHSMIECKASPANSNALKLMMDQQGVKERLTRLVQKIHSESVGKEVTFDCMSDNLHAMMDESDQMPMYRKASDCRRWEPEMPQSVGLYHAHVKGFNKDTRAHKLFIVTSGGCTRLCDTYFNLFLDVGKDMTCRELFDSEETWYLRKACSRNNARILDLVASEFDLPITRATDPYAYEPQSLASCTTETLYHDIVQCAHNRLSVMNLCVETMSCKNGILCGMHPSEGVWIFKGPLQTSSAMSLYGGVFGNERVSTGFPVCTNRVHGKYSWTSKSIHGSLMCKGRPSFVESRGCPSVCKVDTEGVQVDTQARERYTYIDESYLNTLQSDTGWNRDNGIIELIPIAVVAQE